MATVFFEKDSVFFVGGRGTKVGNANAGGCTLEAWNDPAKLNKTLANVMGANGDAVSSPQAWNPGGCDAVVSPFNRVKIMKAASGWFADVKVGQVVYVEFVAVYANGRYEVTDAIDANEFEISLTHTADTTCKVVVGGAFDALQNAVDETDAGNDYDVIINSNIFNYEKGSAFVCDAGNGGSVAKGSHKIIKGFHTQPGDMNYGETYYQSPLDALINGVDITTPKCIRINASGGAYDVMTITNSHNWVFENIYIHNTNKAAGNNGVEFVTLPVNISFINCKFDTAYSIYAGTTYGNLFQRCYIGNGFGHAFVFDYQSGIGQVFDMCVFNSDGVAGLKLPRYTVFSKCLFWKGGTAALIDRNDYFDSCVFYGQTVACIGPRDATYGTVHGANNIFMPAEAADYVACSTADTGSVSVETLRNSCVWTIAGVAVTHHLSIGASNVERQLTDAIEADPQFVDAANGDFRLKVNSPCLKTGMKTLGRP